MSKRRRGKAASNNVNQATQQGSVEAFSFDDPIPMMDQREIFDYLECPTMFDRWYEPPLSWDGLARSFRAAIHHSSPIYVKRNILVSTLRPNPLLSPQAFSRFALEYLVFGNAYLELRKNRLGKPLKLVPSLAKYTRRGVEEDVYWFVPRLDDPHQFNKGAVFHLLEPDINQEMYGLPEYLAALNSTWLNESATLFRRKYYINGNHAGFILYLSSALQNTKEVDEIRQAMKNAKGPGNFRNLLIHAPNGKEKGVQVIPLSEISTKDDFGAIKQETRDDQLAGHRVPPVLMGIMPENTGGFGDAGKAARVFARNEIVPLQNRMMEINEWLGEEVIAFDDYEIADEGDKKPPEIPKR